MDSPSRKYFTIFYFPLGIARFLILRDLHSCIFVHIHCILGIIVLYCMVSYSQSDLQTYPVSQRLAERLMCASYLSQLL